MRTSLPKTYSVDFGKYLDAYFQKPDALTRIPSREEMRELARKAIVREQLVLMPLPKAEPAAEGDTAVLKVRGETPRFNKDRVTVTLGRGLYSRELELSLIGCRAGEERAVELSDQTVSAKILELKRKQVPEPTDEMVAALEAKTAEGKPINTVSEYEALIEEQKTMEVLSSVNYYVVSDILESFPKLDYDEADIKRLGELERESFIKLFLEKEGMDLTKDIPAEWKEHGISSLDSFIESRREWYGMKIQQCLLFLKILGLKAEGKTDPLDHYEVLGELQMKMFELIKSELERRNK